MELYHHGVKGMKWGVRRYQNKDGSLTESGKKREYKKSLRYDKRARINLELTAYDSARFANAYLKKSNSYSKKYEKAIRKDPTKSKSKTQKIENTKRLLDSTTKSWNNYNSENVKKLKNHVDSMISKYSDTKIKDINIKTQKNGVKYIKSLSASMANANAIYSLRKMKQQDAYTYHPVKTRYYYIG